MKITYIAIAAAFVQACLAVQVPCTIDQERACRNFQLGNGDYYFCVCTADVSCQVGNISCNSVKRKECQAFCNTKLTCDGPPCPYPTECSNLWIGGKKTYKCVQFVRSS